MRERIEVEYEDAANSVGHDSAEGGYLLPTMDGHELLEEVGIQWLAKEQLQDDLAAAFMGTPWVHKNPYSLREAEVRELSWENFATLVKHRVRYSQWPPEHEQDDEVTPPAAMLDELGELFETYDLYSCLPVGTELVRARIHERGQEPPNTLRDFGPPPLSEARFSNRMSPAGISMLYAALDEETALAETYVRPDGPPAEASIAIFRLTRELRLLDLTSLPQTPSIFDSDEENLHGAAIGFLHEFTNELSKPVAKDGREHIEYVPSQIVTEYVRYRLEAETGKQVQGIRYRSAQREGGIGCVLFYAHEDIVESEFGPTVAAPFELIGERTRTLSLDTPSDSNVTDPAEPKARRDRS